MKEREIKVLALPDKFYGAYVRDPDGNKLAFFHFG